MIEKLNNIKKLDEKYKDPFLGVSKAEYDTYLNEYLSTSDSNNIIMIDYPNLFMQLAAVNGAKKAYKAEDELEMGSMVKSRGARG